MPRTNGLRRIASWVSIVIVVSSLAGWGLSNRYLGSTTKVKVFGKIDEATRPKAVSTAGMTILAVATDDRTGLTRKQQNDLHVGHGDYGAPRTDTIMLIRIAPNGGGATAVSMPRDSWIAIPAYTGLDGKQHAATHDRINTLYQRGGPELMIRTLEGITDLRIDHYVELNFAGFLTMVDAVGGVPMCIPKNVKDKDAGLDLKAGNHVLTGRQALAYVRARHIDSDFGRMERQQRFIASMVQQVTSAGTLLNPVKLNNFLDAAMSSVKTDETLDRDAVFDLATRFSNLSLSKVRFLTVPISDGNARIDGQSVVLWNDHEAKKLFIRMAKDWPIVKEATSTTTTSTLTVQPGDIKVTVLNATNTTGLARKAAESLANVGFGFDGDPGNAPTTDAKKTIVTYPKAKAEAIKTLQASIPFATFTEKADAKGITILVANDWKAAEKVKVGSTTTTTKTTAVVKTITDPRTAADSICD